MLEILTWLQLASLSHTNKWSLLLVPSWATFVAPQLSNGRVAAQGNSKLRSAAFTSFSIRPLACVPGFASRQPPLTLSQNTPAASPNFLSFQVFVDVSPSVSGALPNTYTPLSSPLVLVTFFSASGVLLWGPLVVHVYCYHSTCHMALWRSIYIYVLPHHPSSS